MVPAFISIGDVRTMSRVYQGPLLIFFIQVQDGFYGNILQGRISVHPVHQRYIALLHIKRKVLQIQIAARLPFEAGDPDDISGRINFGSQFAAQRNISCGIDAGNNTLCKCSFLWLRNFLLHEVFSFNFTVSKVTTDLIWNA